MRFLDQAGSHMRGFARTQHCRGTKSSHMHQCIGIASTLPKLQIIPAEGGLSIQAVVANCCDGLCYRRRRLIACHCHRQLAMPDHWYKALSGCKACLLPPII